MDGNWQTALSHLSDGNFTALQNMLGGADGFDRQIIEWFEAGKFNDEPEMLAEVLTCACMLGRTETAAFLIDKGVDTIRWHENRAYGAALRCKRRSSRHPKNADRKENSA